MTEKTSKKRTMDGEYSDGSDHLVCNNCGMCIDCGDCKKHGCGLEDCGELDKEDSDS